MNLRRILATAIIGLSLVISAFSQERIRDVIYQKRGGFALTMDVFKPAKPNGIACAFMVSGGWVSDHNNINPAFAKFMTDAGITCFMVVHGAQPRFQVPEIVEDINRAIRFIRFNAKTYSIDPNKIGISGGSAGGHLSLMMAAFGGPGKPEAKDPIDRESSAVNAVACLFPPTDFMNWGAPGKVAFENPMLMMGFGKAFGATKDTPKDKLAEFSIALSPMRGFTEKTCPVLLIHGDKDPLVPLQQSEIAVAKLKSLGVDARLIVRPGKGHGWPDLAPDAAEMVAWFTSHLNK